jgi:hypothetical protein
MPDNETDTKEVGDARDSWTVASTLFAVLALTSILVAFGLPLVNKASHVEGTVASITYVTVSDGSKFVGIRLTDNLVMPYDCYDKACVTKVEPGDFVSLDCKQPYNRPQIICNLVDLKKE